MTPMREAMEQLAASLGVEIIWPDERQPTPDELRVLPSTERLERELTRCQVELEKWGSGRTSGLGYEHRALSVKVAERHVRWGWIRDQIEARWTDECRCYGDGRIVVPAVRADDGTELEAAYLRYCPCQAGDALRAAHGRQERIMREHRTHELDHRIFEEAGDDFDLYRSVTFDTYRERMDGHTLAEQRACKALLDELYVWTQDRSAPWLVLTGPTGTGKTGLAVACMRRLAAQGYRGMIVREKSLLDRIRATYNRRGADDDREQDVLDALRRVPVLAIDDMAAPGSTSTDWAQGQLFDVLNARYSARRRTILTSNLDAESDDLSAYVGPRIWSRIVERTEGERWALTVNGPDLRQAPVVRPALVTGLPF